MNWLFASQLLAAIAALFCIVAFSLRLGLFLHLSRPLDRSKLKGDPGKGVAYALTLGMAPWAKESTRRHALAYLRGVGFHVPVFLAFGVLLASPWLKLLPVSLRTGLVVVAAFGALLALMGFLSRFIEKGLKALSTPDDYFAVLLVSLFLAVTAMALWQLSLLPWFYGTSALVLFYMPLGKIRHCIYFFFSRLFFGKFFGRRAIFPHGQKESVA